ncbi:MAG: tRNA 2-thiouridine(34) synthase MnmA [Bacteroidota bacterium]
MKRVVVGLSGGVDSSVAAYLLKEEGYEVIGLFMKNWHDESVTLSNDCPWIDDSNDALLIANSLNIPFQVIDLSEAYKTRIVDYMFDEYASGRTPNPDVLCNREIKFDVFMDQALALGADYVATGHYCRTAKGEDGSVQLLAGKDQNKDQSYFLCQLRQEQLEKALFPIGHLQKSEVREIARKEGLITADKKDSQGLCFVGKISLPDFLQQQLAARKGDVIEIPENDSLLEDYHALPHSADQVEALATPFTFKPTDGAKVAEHSGAHFYTIGQRKGLHIGGRPHPSFVIQTDTNKNIVYSGQKSSHKALNRIALKIDPSTITYTLDANKITPGEQRHYQFRIRYRQPLQSGILISKPTGIYVLFDELQRGITPGQFCAFYDGEQLIGSGVITS